MAAAVAGVIGLVPTVLIASPAHADPLIDGNYSIADASGAEGGYVTFRITRDAPAPGGALLAETVTWTAAVGGGTATTADFTAATGTVSFGTNSGTSSQSRTISVLTTQDTTDEEDETFEVTLTSTVGSPDVTFGDATATGTIVDDDNPTYTLTSTPITVNESASDPDRHATIRATLSEASPYDITIPIETVEGTATSGVDYEPVNDQITILAGQTFGTIPVEITDDEIDEPDIQSFTVKTSAGTNVTGTQTATVNIADDDAAPTIEIGSPGAQLEGQTLTFPVTLSEPSENTVTATWTTADLTAATAPGNGVAKAGADYTAASGTVTFAPLATSPTTPVTITTLSDELDELSPEEFNVKLSAPQNATLSPTDNTAVGGITDSGSYLPPQIVLTPGEITEGSEATSKTRTFTVSLTRPSGQTQEVDYSIAPGTANLVANIGVASSVGANADFTDPADGTLTFQPGETSKTFTIDIMGDSMDEGAGENIAITLSDGIGGVLTDGRSMGTTQVTITDDDAKPVLSVTKADITMPETDGPAAALYEVKLSNPSDHDVDWTVAPAVPAGSATTGGVTPGSNDYTLLSPTLGSGSVLAGQTSSYVLVVVNGDQVYEPDETARWTVTRDSDDYATGGPVTTTLTITDDDPAPALAIDAKSANEGETVALTGTVMGLAQAATVLSVTLAGKSVDGSVAASGDDFSPAAMPATIPAGTPSGSTVSIGNVTIADDQAPEWIETIAVNGTGFNNTGSVTEGVITIAASDGGTAPTDPTDPGSDAPTLNASSSFRLGAGSVTLTGTATANTAVELWGRTVNSDGDGDYAKISDATASSSGTFSFTPGLSTDGMYFRVAADGQQSAAVRVYIRQDPDLTAVSTSTGVVRLTVTGDPKIRGLAARVFRANANGTWTNVGSGILNASGTFSRTLTGQTSGRTFTYRAYVVGDGDRGVLTNYSSYTRSVRVK